MQKEEDGHMAVSPQREDISLIEGVWSGPVRQPVNASLNEKGSIHDPERAKELGLRGGTVAGSIHMEQFPPVLERGVECANQC